MKTLIFTLTMPGNNLWNGRWSGDQLYAAKRKVKDSKAGELAGKAFSHNFGDGWRACVSVRCPVDSADTRKTIKRSSVGFGGYDWMIDNILRYGQTREPVESVEPRVEAPRESGI